MRILTVHPAACGASHLIPLFVLHKRYIERLATINNKFLTPKPYHTNLKSQGIHVVDIDNSINQGNLSDVILSNTSENIKIQQKISAQLQQNIEDAITSENPDLIIEDFEPFTVLPSKELNIPRISIHRTGFFRSIPNELRNPNHIHSCEKSKSGEKLYDASVLLGNSSATINTLDPKTKIMFTEYANADAKIIPGIPSIEVLPENIKHKDSYFYSGPLTVEDNPSQALVNELASFLNKNISKKKVFITTGTIDRSSLEDYVQLLLKKGYAVITTQKLKLDASYNDAVFYNSFLPLNYIASKVDLFIHQCGSGIYHYPILNMTAFITIGTRCYDREDVAQRLQLLNVGKHVPHPKDDSNYLTIFEQYLNDFETGSLTDFTKMEQLKEEIYETMLSFNFQEVVDFSLAQHVQSI